MKYIRGIAGKVKKAAGLRLFTSSALIKVAAEVMGRTAKTGQWSDLCLAKGFLPMPVHFYSPIPDLKDLEERRVWEAKSSLAGIDFGADRQVILLNELGQKYGEECNWPVLPTADPYDFYLDNQSFNYGCAASTHAMFREFKPKRVIEIGSGMSSLVICKAIELNRLDGSGSAEYSIADPYPREIIKKGLPGVSELIARPVEHVKPEFFDRLKENDVLFIDSGHSVRIGGDVNFLYLEVLPRLAPGVIVHIHDISLPYEYPKAYATSEVFRQFWTEQYLLQSFLCYNDEFEVLLAMNYLMTDHFDTFKQAFALYDSGIHRAGSGSFWMRRKRVQVH